MKLSDEFKVGVFATFAIAILIVGFNYLKGRDLFSDTVTLKAVYNNLDGLAKSNPVFYYGDEVGKVSSKERNYNDGVLEFTISMSISPEVRIPKGSIAKIVSSDLLQSKAIEILPAEDKGEYVVDGDELDGETEISLTDKVSRVITPLKANAEKLMEELTTTLGKLEGMLDEEAKDNIRNSLGNFQKSSKKLSALIDKSSDDMSVILDDFKGASASIKETSGKLSYTVDNVNALTDSLRNTPIKSTVEDVKVAVASLQLILESLNEGEGTAAMLLNDPSLYNDLNTAIKELETLAQDIQEHPRHYFSPLGKKTRKDWAKDKETTP